MLGVAVCVGDGEAVLHGILGRVIVVRVVDLLVHNGLDVRVLGRVDLQAAGVEQVAGLALRIVQLFHQVLYHLLDQLVREIAVGIDALFFYRVHVLDAAVDVVGQGLFLLGFCDFFLLVHVLQYDSPAFRIGLGPSDGI